MIYCDEISKFKTVQSTKMKRHYVTALGLGFKAEAVLKKWQGGMLLASIHVPEEHRGHRHGTALLRKVLADADRCGTRLFLHATSFGEMSDGDLEAWYKRHGFVWKSCLIFEREPIAAKKVL